MRGRNLVARAGARDARRLRGGGAPRARAAGGFFFLKKKVACAVETWAAAYSRRISLMQIYGGGPHACCHAPVPRAVDVARRLGGDCIGVLVYCSAYARDRAAPIDLLLNLVYNYNILHARSHGVPIDVLKKTIKKKKLFFLNWC